MRFWDASAVVPLCLRQSASDRMRAVLEEDPDMAVWWGTPVECHSAFARLMREGGIPRGDDEMALSALDALAGNWFEIAAKDPVREGARRAVRLHGLRTGDAFQLSAALTWCRGNPPGHGFVTLDERLADAAVAEGFKTVGRER